jgi:hypothetical protein
LQAVKYSDFFRVQFFDSLLTSSTPVHELNFILLLDYKFRLPKYDINNPRFVGLAVCAIGK